MIPLGDESRRPSHFPIVTWAIVALNVLVFLVELNAGEAFITRWSVIPADIAAGRKLETVLTAMFMHASWMHIIGNMVFLHAFGPELEDAMGGPRYLVFYLLGGIAAMAAQVGADPASSLPNLGASGAIAAVMGGFLVTHPTDRIRTLLVFGFFVRITFLPAVLLIGIWFLIQLVDWGVVAETAQTSGQGGVAYLAHIGGIIFGALTARLFEAGRPVRDLGT